MPSTAPSLSLRQLPASTLALFGATIFLSAFLLFSLEPLIAKRILPWFGGSAAVWSVCLVFYQTALLLGYLYATLLTRYGAPAAQTCIHIGLMCVSLIFLPIGPSGNWMEVTGEPPAWLILAMLAATIAVPFITLSATSPLLQHWLAQSGYDAPYRLFAISNLASLCALLAYPSIIEPLLDTSLQTTIWSSGYLLFVILCGFVRWRSINFSRNATPEPAAERIWVLPTRKLAWFALSACSSVLLLSVTNHLAENVAAVPLLWVLPLAIYLITFILAFGARANFNRSLWLRALAFALGILGYSVYDINAVLAVQISIPVFLTGLFICCLFCHSELNRLRPPSEDLTSFYLIIAAGGAAGAVFVGLIAPGAFSGIYELPAALVFTAALVTLLTWSEGAWPVRALWIGVTASMIAIVGANVYAYHENALDLRRSFYGSLRVVQSPRAGIEQKRTLFHGIIEHGSQFFLPPRRFRATTYYGPESGIGILLRECFSGPKRVGIVGLGTGTIAAYGKNGDTFRFYEINGQVIDIAYGLFYYLRESRAVTQVVEGDARLSLARETAPPFDVLALDAFSGDAVPVHLLTQEAVALYRQHLTPHGVLAFHVSNLFLDLPPVVKQLAESIGSQAVLVRNHNDLDNDVLPADWVLVTNNPAVLSNPSIRLHALPITSRRNTRPWTDHYNNLIEVLKAPQIHSSLTGR
ncbi:MAG: fused MFS/spermidine synthase [Acidobacteriaceae bacterium]|nr:fused MFS/spermidine synthase [Acidobacteriaceae bacterium]